jgi:hypothetical protein
VSSTLNVWGAMTFQSASLYVGTGATPVSQTPLPPSWTMMLIGLIGIGLFAYRQQRQPLTLGVFAAAAGWRGCPEASGGRSEPF